MHKENRLYNVLIALLVVALIGCGKDIDFTRHDAYSSLAPAEKDGWMAGLFHITAAECELTDKEMERYDDFLKNLAKERTKEKHLLYRVVPWIYDRQYHSTMDQVLERGNRLIEKNSESKHCEDLIDRLKEI